MKAKAPAIKSISLAILARRRSERCNWTLVWIVSKSAARSSTALTSRSCLCIQASHRILSSDIMFCNMNAECALIQMYKRVYLTNVQEPRNWTEIDIKNVPLLVEMWGEKWYIENSNNKTTSKVMSMSAARLGRKGTHLRQVHPALSAMQYKFSTQPESWNGTHYTNFSTSHSFHRIQIDFRFLNYSCTHVTTSSIADT